MTKPRVIKTDGRWHVVINGRAWNTRKTWEDALAHGNRIAGYAHRIRDQREIQRIHASLERIKENR